jgi:hypothetical protein
MGLLHFPLYLLQLMPYALYSIPYTLHPVPSIVSTLYRKPQPLFDLSATCLQQQVSIPEQKRDFPPVAHCPPYVAPRHGSAWYKGREYKLATPPVEVAL